MTPNEGQRLLEFLARSHSYANVRMELKPIADDPENILVYQVMRGKIEGKVSRVSLGRALLSDLAHTAIGRQLREEEIEIDYRVISKKSPAIEK